MREDDVLIKYVQAVEGQASTVKKHLPFLCPDVNYIERMLDKPETLVILAKDENAIVGVVGGWLA